MTVIFYDIPSKLPENAWSPNTWKTRFYLNYRRIPYKTEWIEYPDIKAFSLKHSIAPTFVPPPSSGREPYYSLPAIHDTETGVYIADSQAIAEYLDETYPESITGVPGAFPDGTLGLQIAFRTGFDRVVDSHVMFLVPIIAKDLNPSSEEYFRRTRCTRLNVKVLEDAEPKGEEAEKKWTQLEAEFKKLAKWYHPKIKGKYIMGDKPTWADIVVASELIWMKIVWGDNSKKWQDVMRWDDGKWKEVFESMKPFSDASL